MTKFYKMKNKIKYIINLNILISVILIPSMLFGFMAREGVESRSRAVVRGITQGGFIPLDSNKISQGEDAWSRFLKSTESDVKLIGRAEDGNVYRILGGGINLSPQRGLISRYDLEDACRDFVKENKEILKLDADEITLLNATHRKGISFIDFGQLYKGYTVFGSRISFIVTDVGEVLSITLGHYTGITLSEDFIEGPEIAENSAWSDLNTLYPDFDFSLLHAELCVYPQMAEEDLRFTWAFVFEFRNEKPLMKWQYIVDAINGNIIIRRDLGRYFISGHIRGQILPRYAKDSPVEVSMPNIKVICLRNDPPLMFNALDTDPGWLGTALYGWEFGKALYPVTTGAGGPGPEKGITGNNFYGYNLSGCYPLNMWSSQYLTTVSAVNCSGKNNIYLRFWRWLGVEGSEEDHASLEIADGPSSTWWKVWVNPEEDLYDGGWRLILYDISKWADGREKIFFRWGMGPTNGYVSYCGWNIDDIGVYSSISALTDQDGNYRITGEAKKNILSAYLEGKYFKVINEDGANIIYTTNEVASGVSNRNFMFTRITDYDLSTKIGTINSLSDIDEINVYYHANRLLDYIQEIDPEFLTESAEGFPVNITVRYDREYNNSFWMPDEGIFFGEGDKLEFGNFTHYADIIYHETGHAVTDYIYAGKDVASTAARRFSEFDAMHEAFSDYWACTITNDSKIAEGGFWIDHDSVRDLNNELNYILNYGQELYQSSLILAGAMWDLRQELRKQIGDDGIRIADTIFHYAQLAQPTTYIDFLINCQIVNQVKFGNAYGSLIKEVFGKRGISQAPASPNTLIVTIESQGVSLQWSQSPEAIGYFLYYGQNKAVRPLYMQDGGGSGDSSSSDGGGGMDGSGGSSTSTPGTPSGSSSSSTSSSQNTQSSSNQTTTTLDSKLDVGNTTKYYLTGLDPTVTYRVKVTAYNLYGVESPPSEEALIAGSTTPTTSDTTNTNTGDESGYTWEVEPGEIGLGQGVTCFISTCGSGR